MPSRWQRGRWDRSMICWRLGGYWIGCCALRWRRSRRRASSWSSAMIPLARTRAMRLRLDLAESPAPAAVLWELVGEAERRAAIARLSALIAEAVVGPVVE